MAATVAALTVERRRPRPAVRWPDAIGANLSLESGPSGCQRVPGDIFVDVNRLGVLSEVIQPRKAAGAVALERSLAGVFSTSTVC